MHLREALRHAPDAQVQPPPALSALILSEARAKARDAKVPERPARRPLLALWDWLARPSVAAGFAGLMVATLVGVMWWDQPMNEALPQRPAPAAAPAATAPSVAAPPVASAPEAAPKKAPAAEAERRAPEPPHAALRKSAPAADKAAVSPAKPAAPPPAPAPPAPAAREELAADAKAAAAPPARESAPITALSLPPPVVPAPATTQAPPAGATAGGLAKSKSADESESKRARSVTAANAVRSYAEPKAELSDQRVQQDVQVRTTLVRLRAAIAADPTHWAWQRGDGTAQGMNDAIYAWLAQLDSTTGSRWQPRAARETGALLGRELRLLRDGRLEHSLRLTENGVLWEQGQSAWQVDVPPATLTQLQTALDTAAP
jgi:hypothetical protein